MDNPGLSEINISFRDGTEISFLTKKDQYLQSGEKSFLILKPDAHTCAKAIIKMIFTKYSISFIENNDYDFNDQLKISSDGNQLILKWLGENPPDSFFELQSEINRMIKLKAFW